MGQGRVLTAAHNVGGGELLIRVGGEREYRATIVASGSGEAADLALLEIVDTPFGQDLEPVRFAAVDRGSAKPVLGCWAVGFPRFKEKAQSSRAAARLRDSAHLRGEILPGANLVSGLLELQVTATPRPLPPGEVSGSEWQGISGAVVFAGDDRLGDCAVGVVVEHHRPEGESSLTVVPVTALERIGQTEDRGRWWQLLGVPDPSQLVVLPGPTEQVQQAPSAPMALFQLPPDIKDFTDRDGELARVCGLVERRRPPSDTAPIVVAIAGMPGVGKTALAIRAAHQLGGRFPDGQLYINLRGAEGQRRDPGDVLADLLSILGVHRTGIPSGLEGRGAMYRDRLANRRVLVLLDNAADAEQVEPLLPGSPSCAVLVTSRSLLVELTAHAHALQLDIFDKANAVELLHKVVGTDQDGADRVMQEPDAARAIAHSCGYLPLAVSIAGAKLRVRGWRLGKLVDRLSDERRRLRELQVGNLGVRAILALSYQDLAKDPQEPKDPRDPRDQPAFRLLGLLPASSFTTWTAAALFDCDPAAAEELLDRFVDIQLLKNQGEDATGQIRYRLHDLIRDFAREQLEEGSEMEQQAALDRVLTAHLEQARQARIALEARDSQSPGRDQAANQTSSRQPDAIQALRQDPLLWFRQERANLVAAVQQASETERWSLTLELTGALDAFFRRDAQWNDWQRTQKSALHAARQLDDHRSEATVHRNLGSVYWEQGHWDAAVTEMKAALQGFEELGDGHETAVTRLELGRIYRERSQWRDARRCLEEARSEFHGLDEPPWEGKTLRSLGKLELDQGRLKSAWADLERALLILTEVGDRHDVALTLRDQGLTYHAQGHLEEAAGHLEQAIAEFQQLGDRRYEYVTRADLGNVHHDQGHREKALDCLEQAQAVFRELGDRRWEAIVLIGLGKLSYHDQDFEAALQSFEQARAVFADLNDRLWEARAMREVGSVHAARNDLAAARAAWESARKVFQELNVPEANQVPTWAALGDHR